MTVGPGGRVGGGGYVVGVAHNDFDADAFPTKAARNGYAEDFATEFNRRKLDEGVDAEAWALNDGVNLGGSLETCQCHKKTGTGSADKARSGSSNPGGRGRTVFERDNTHGLDADRDKFNIHLDATSDDSQAQEHARRHLIHASGIATGEVTHTTGPLVGSRCARTESVASGVSTISTLRSSRHTRPPSDTPKPAVKLTEPPILIGGGAQRGYVNSI